jgi:predicted ferric reductase
VNLHVAISVIIAAVWLLVGPTGGPYQNHVAELLGVESVWLMTSSVLTLARSRRVERAVGGVEGALWWHRVAGALGVGLGLIHPSILVPAGGAPSLFAGVLGPLSFVAVVLVAWAFMSPTSRAATWRGPLGWLARRSFDRWRGVHAVLALFLVIAMVHGVIDSRSLMDSPILLMIYTGICLAGLYALTERVIIARLKFRAIGGTVVGIERFGERIAVLTIASDRPLEHQAGQFVELGVPVSNERPHPFTIASAPGAPMVQVAIHAAGPGTARIVRGTTIGDRVSLGAVRGQYRHDDAGSRQVWVAGGIGITPFVSWVRSQGAEDPRHRVDLVWTRHGFGDMPFVDELGELAKQSSWLAVHLHDTSRLPRLTAAEIVSMGGADITSLTVFACAAATTVHSWTTELVRLGVPHERIHSEAFAFR